MKEIIAIIAFSFGCLTMVFGLRSEIKLGTKAENLIEQCESELPRNQNCILKAEPDNE